MTQQQEIDLFWKATVDAVDSILICLEQAPPAMRNWRPAAGANSLYVLGVHVLGSTEEHILEGICGEAIGRRREAEFTSSGLESGPVRKAWGTLRERIENALNQLPEGSLDRECLDPRLGSMSAREIFLIVARHTAEHKGHADLTLDLIRAGMAGIDAD